MSIVLAIYFYKFRRLVLNREEQKKINLSYHLHIRLSKILAIN